MVYMVRLLTLIFFIFSSLVCYSAEIKENISDDKIEFTFTFVKGYSAFEKLVDDNNKKIIFTFETSEKIQYPKQNYFDMPVKSVYLVSDGYKKQFIVEFKQSVLTPAINKDDKKILIEFALPKTYESTAADNVTAGGTVVNQNNVSPTSVGTYARMLFGLFVVLIIISVLFWVLKIFFKKQIFTDIPGSGRLLGKVDLELRKSLYFYEIGDIVYIIGVSDGGMNLIDKISDEAEITKIRSGFLTKYEFKGYMSFFKNKKELDDKLSTSSAIVEEKLKAMRRKKKDNQE